MPDHVPDLTEIELAIRDFVTESTLPFPVRLRAIKSLGYEVEALVRKMQDLVDDEA